MAVGAIAEALSRYRVDGIVTCVTLPAPDSHIDIDRVNLDAMADAAHPLGSDQS